MAQRGRPPKTWEDVKSKLPEDWFEQLTEIAENGGVEIHFKVKFRQWAECGNNLWQRFKEEEEEFKESLKYLLDLSTLWWWNAVKRGAFMGKDCNAAVLIFGASNAHPEHFRRNVEKKDPNDEKVQTIVFKFGDEGLKANG